MAIAPPASTAYVSTARVAEHTDPHLLECHDCGLVQRVPALPPGARATCARCDAVLRTTRHDPFGLPLALNLTGLMLFGLGASMTLMSLSSTGQHTAASLLSGPLGLERYGQAALAIVVIITTVAIPLARVVGMLAVLLALRVPRPPPWTKAVYATVEHLRPWSMIEIYLLGVFVAYVKLVSMAHIDLGLALYALAALTVAMVAADAVVDDHAIWEAIDRGHRPGRARVRSAGILGARLLRIGCHTCGMVSRGRDGAHCPRCGFKLHHRKPQAIARAWALLIAAVILYIPANIYPVLIIHQLGSNLPSTILGGVHELMLAGMWPLALLVFVASIVVPILKIICLAVLLISTQMHATWGLKERTVLYRVVDFVGRWSMIDVFMVSLLVALVQFGSITSIAPGNGATAFAAVVILTMFAAESFDPRLMWDAAEQQTRHAA
jgi:paraquat-inducible protein A